MFTNHRFCGVLVAVGLAVIVSQAGDPAVASAQVYVANSGSGTVSVLSTPGNTLVAEIPVDSLPSRIAVTPDGAFVYVTNGNSGTMSKISAASNSVVATIPVGSLPKGVAVSPDGTAVFVIADNALKQFSVATNTPIRVYALPIGVPVDVAIAPNGAFAYVVDTNQNICSLYPIDLTTGEIKTSAFCATTTGLGAVGGSFPRAVAVRPDGQFAYVTAFQDGALQVVRLSDYHYAGGGCVIVGCPLAGGGPTGVAVSKDGRFAFTANSMNKTVSIFALDQASGLPALPVQVPLVTKPSYLDVTPDGRRLYVSHGSNTVSVIDLTSNPPALTGTITVGNNPLGVAVSPLASGPIDSGTLSLSVTPPGGLAFVGEQGLGDPAAQSIQVGAVGVGSLGWALTAIAPNPAFNDWFQVGPTAGAAPPTTAVQVSAGTCGLAAGTYGGTVSVTSAQATNSPQSVPVTLTVTAPGGPLPLPAARACTDRSTYRAGETLTLKVSLRQGVASNTGDAYLFTGIPGDTNVVSLVLTEGGIVPSVGPVPVPLGTGFAVTDLAGPIFQRVFEPSDPQGTYTVLAVLVAPGSDPTVAANRLVEATTSFTVTP